MDLAVSRITFQAKHPVAAFHGRKLALGMPIYYVKILTKILTSFRNLKFFLYRHNVSEFLTSVPGGPPGIPPRDWNGPRKGRRPHGLFLEDSLELFGESGDDLEDVADYAVCGDFEDGRIGILIDGENNFR